MSVSLKNAPRIVTSVPSVNVSSPVTLSVALVTGVRVTDLEKFRVLRDNFGAEIRYNNDLHAKMIIIDNSIAIISSANLTKKGLSVNYEAGVCLKDKNMIKEITLFFDDVWNESRPLTEQAIKNVLSNKKK